MSRIFLFTLLSVLCLPSCATRIIGTVDAGGGAELRVYAALEPRMSALIRGFAAAAGIAPGTALLDGPAMAESLAAAPGIDAASFANTSPVSIDGEISVPRIAGLLASGGTDFVTFTQGASGGGRFSVGLDRDSGRAILALISDDIAGYLGALMAPIATGETMTRAGYVALVGAVYGAGIAEEISAATIRIWLDFPGPVQRVVGGTFSGRRAEFAIPLLDVLVLETPLRYEVVWR